MDFLYAKHDEIVENLFLFFRDQLERDPHATLKQVEQELNALYIRYGNDWTGRGIIGDNTQQATIAGLEAVRAECLARLGHRSTRLS
ncbi:MAG: hypothetical protein JXR59_05910 [Desulfuromonadaceae bacterium]|nr:hypothetical protein [Desulfuromonadaceae bacterium]